MPATNRVVSLSHDALGLGVAIACVCAVTTFSLAVQNINGPTRAVSWLHLPLAAFVTLKFGPAAGAIAAVLGAASFLGVIAPINGVPPDVWAGLFAIVAASATVFLIHTAQTPVVKQPVPRNLIGWLGFIREQADRNRSYWAVEATGHYAQDCATGENLARDLIAEIQRTGNRHLLGWAVKEMPRNKDFTGIEIGFLTEISRSIANDDPCDCQIQARIINGYRNGDARLIGDQGPGQQDLSK